MVGTVDFVIETKATSDDHGRRALVYSTLHYHHNGILKQYVTTLVRVHQGKSRRV